MKKVRAVVQLIRLPNLIFIVLTQWLAYECLVVRGLGQSMFQSNYSIDALPRLDFLWLTLSTVLIAAAGYMINDYFDMGIDTINKPEKVTIEKVFSRRSIIAWHSVLNMIALVIASSIFIEHLKWRFLIIQLGSITLLVLYSTTFKRKLLIGNICIALLTALTVFSVGVYHPKFDVLQLQFRPIQVFWLYIVFAFLITMIREVVKDLEDMKGDSSQHCTTVPLVWGVQRAKYICYGLAALLLALIILALIMKASPSWVLNALWVIGIVCPLGFVMVQLHHAQQSVQFRKLSSQLKWITLAGILSMIFV